jgi:putative pyruvate formate lyase activating enzyme
VDKEYSKIDNYFEIATEAIQEMIRQVGIPKLNEKGVMQKGVMIRHLVLPSYIENSKKVLKWIKDNLDDKIYVSIMAQYFPTYKAKEYEKINRKLTKEEWKEIENYIEKLEIENGYMQELGEHEEEYVPKWDI